MPNETNRFGTTVLVLFYLGFVAMALLVLNSSFLIFNAKNDGKMDQEIRNVISIVYVVFMAVSLVSMIPFVCLSNDRRLNYHDVCPVLKRIGLPILVAHCIIVTICVFIMLRGVFKSTDALNHNEIIDVLLHLTVAVFCTVQASFICIYRHVVCNNLKLKLPTCIVISADIGLCIGTSFTFAYRSSGTDLPRSDKLNEQADRLYLSFMFGFCTISLLYLFKMLALHNTPLSSVSESGENENDAIDNVIEVTFTNRILDYFCKIYIMTFRLICRYTLIWSVCLCLSLLIYRLVNADDSFLFLDKICIPLNMFQNETNTEDDYTNSIMQSSFYYVTCVVAVFGSVLAAKHKQSTRRLSDGKFSTEEVILMLSGCSQVIVVIFQIMEVSLGIIEHSRSDLSMKLFYLFKAVFHIPSLFSQTYIILKYFRDSRAIGSSTNRNLYIRAVVVFLAVVNTDRWIRNLLFSPSATDYINSIDVQTVIFGRDTWCQLSKCVNPAAVFYRLLSAIMLCAIFISSRESAQSPE